MLTISEFFVFLTTFGLVVLGGVVGYVCGLNDGFDKGVATNTRTNDTVPDDRNP